MDDDYYELLGVDDDAPVDDIRSAYRDKKAAVDTSAGDEAKSDVARLNKAWNVLSDPYQRGRYDQQRAVEYDDDEYEDDTYDYDDVPDVTPGARGRSRVSDRTSDRAERRRGGRQPLKPTVKLPAGVHFPTMKQRLLAMGIDLLILIGLFFAGSIGVLPAIEKSQHPEAYNAARKLVKTTIPAAEDKTSAAKKAASAAEDKVDALTERRAPSSEIDEAKAEFTALDKKADAAKKVEDDLNDDLTEHNKVLLPLQNLITGLVFLAALLILVVPSVFGRQSLGKETQRIRVIRVDGSPARFGDAFRRYGMLVFAGFALSLLLGPTGGLVAVFVATLWTRNPNQQGLHDRLSKTLVVADDT
jgi:curved DNA-binding protein CbpA